ncbi:MAG: YaaA family protein [Rikenellaceae bacterium]
MLILISCAKLMNDTINKNGILESYHTQFTQPRFQKNAIELAEHIAHFSVSELQQKLKVNDQIAQETHRNFQEFAMGEKEQIPALFHYNGIVFRNIDPENLTHEQIVYAQIHLRITSFLYGLLRPLDLIEKYRLEGKFPIKTRNVFDYWKTKLTDKLIEDVNQAGGVLCNLASAEMKNLFDWKKVESQVEVITPEFLTQKNGKQKTIVVYTKMARGEMTKFIIENQIKTPSKLIDFAQQTQCELGVCNQQTIQFVKNLNN